MTAAAEVDVIDGTKLSYSRLHSSFKSQVYCLDIFRSSRYTLPSTHMDTGALKDMTAVEYGLYHLHKKEGWQVVLSANQLQIKITVYTKAS